jgi:predicted nucleic acid-binding protein
VIEPARWVVDTSTYTHLCRAGYAPVIQQLAPCGVVLIPRQVETEIAKGSDKYPSIPSVSSVGWARTVVLDDDDELSAMFIKARLGGGANEHIGECAVIAYAQRRGLVAVLDDRAAVEQADRLDVESIGTMWIVVEAYKTLWNRDRDAVIAAVDALLSTDMRLPLSTGAEVFAWAYEEGRLP